MSEIRTGEHSIHNLLVGLWRFDSRAVAVESTHKTKHRHECVRWPYRDSVVSNNPHPFDCAVFALCLTMSRSPIGQVEPIVQSHYKYGKRVMDN